VERLIGYRAEMIARQETIVAAYQGSRETWRQADEVGLLPDAAVQQWIVATDDRLCDICEPLDGLTARLDEPFAPGIYQPGDPHPACRCAITLRPFGVRS
jgi:SPP1 gp7 family putative phage head morphogenesis protein